MTCQVEAHNDLLVKKLQEQETLRSELEEKIRHLTKLILVSTSVEPPGRKGLGLKTSGGSALARPLRSRSHTDADDSADERDSPAPAATTSSSALAASAPSRGAAAAADSELLRHELKERDGKLECLRETLELLNKNLRALKEEVGWKDEQLRLLRDQNRAKDDKLDRLLELKGDAAADELELLRGTLMHKYAQSNLTLQQTIAERTLHSDSLAAENRVLKQQLADARSGLRETLALLDHYDNTTRRLDAENLHLRTQLATHSNSNGTAPPSEVPVSANMHSGASTSTSELVASESEEGAAAADAEEELPAADQEDEGSPPPDDVPYENDGDH